LSLPIEDLLKEYEISDIPNNSVELDDENPRIECFKGNLLRGSLIGIYLRQDIGHSKVSWRERLATQLPFSVYFGRISVATIANLAAALVSVNWNDLELSDATWTSLVPPQGATQSPIEGKGAGHQQVFDVPPHLARTSVKDKTFPASANGRGTLIVGVPKESAADERRVSLVPDATSRLPWSEVLVERGAGEGALYPDSAYVQKGAKIVGDRQAIYANADIVVKVQPPTADEARLLREGAVLVSFLYPVTNLEVVQTLAVRRVSAFAMDLIPRISRAQPIDALSSQATISGYKAVLLAADSLPKLFPMLMTAAGTIPPARVLVLGAGVAGLQAIATARRLGAIVEAYDIRPTVKEQVESLGAKFVELAVEAKEAQDAGGYAKAQTQEFYSKQQELIAERTRASDVVIATALVPGKRAPVLISKEAVLGMGPGSVIVDLAAEQGGNCALTEPGQTVIRNGVTIHGPLNLPSSMAPQASALYSRNATSLLQVLIKDGTLNIDLNDELVRGPLVTHNGEVLHKATRAALEGSS